MNYKIIWKTALVVIIVISAIMFASSLFGIYKLPDVWVRILGAADIIAVLVLVFSFVKSYMKH